MFIVFTHNHEGYFHEYSLKKMKMNGIGSRNTIDTIRSSSVSLHYDRTEKTLFMAEMSRIKSYQDESLYFNLFHKYL